MDKKELRRQMTIRRDRLTETKRSEWSEKVMENLWRIEAFRGADMILSYCSFRSEVDTEKINQRILEEGKQLFLPKTYPERREMVFYRIRNQSDLECGYQGIMEPKEGETLLWDQKSGISGSIWMLMPGVAYDAEGNRIGYGGGYYDRYLAKYGEKIDETCMLAFEIQKAEKIETELCDIRPGRIVTDRR